MELWKNIEVLQNKKQGWFLSNEHVEQRLFALAEIAALGQPGTIYHLIPFLKDSNIAIRDKTCEVINIPASYYYNDKQSRCVRHAPRHHRETIKGRRKTVSCPKKSRHYYYYYLFLFLLLFFFLVSTYYLWISHRTIDFTGVLRSHMHLRWCA